MRDLQQLSQTTYTLTQAFLPNILNQYSTESFKFQILVDHLKPEEFLTTSNAFDNPYYSLTDTMTALNQQYKQPH